MGRNKVKITELYIYPIKSLRPVSLHTTRLQQEGLQHDRRFMLLKVIDPSPPSSSPHYKNIQTAYFPECTLFDQALDDTHEHVIVTHRKHQRSPLRVPLRPHTVGLETVEVRLFGSAARTHRMGDPYDDWFTSCLGYRAVLVYIGDHRRAVLAHAPSPPPPVCREQARSWFTSITSFLPRVLPTSGGGLGEAGEGVDDKEGQDEGERASIGGLTFNEAAPFLVTSKASLREVSARLPEGETMDMIKFRPNIVVDDISDEESDDEITEEEGGSWGEKRTKELKAWEEDFWAELLLARDGKRLALTANCARCISINIDYETGRPASGEQGTVLKKLMKDRRVDTGNKWSPIFGRYAFLLPPLRDHVLNIDDQEDEMGRGQRELIADVAVGDVIKVTKRIRERDVWAWPK
ncbi:MOSC domain-containing protein [Hypoxylon fragiforme]|uniref:MOSC domain-containing protein n=1 Tax=Hypoxylon fragiforme TaxID=63214 RepID=UPI0020C71616|nr:MOSC domain-containing protein [Hypoxylon fragiforme]KAI2606861.1 MOSC domain-containing protein [Hypoxylon fragiforme]